MQKPHLKIHETRMLNKGFFELKEIEYSHSLYRGGESAVLPREVFCHGPAVVVLLVDEAEDCVVLIEQCRAGAVMNEVINQDNPIENAWIIEPVAGLVEVGEDPIEAVKRECLEEVGIVPERIEFITEYYPSPGACDEVLLLYVGYVDSTVMAEFGGLEDEDEDIKILKFPISSLSEHLKQNTFKSSTTIIACQWLLMQKM